MNFGQAFCVCVLLLAAIAWTVEVRRAFRQYSFTDAAKRIAIALVAMVAISLFASLCIVWGTAQWHR